MRIALIGMSGSGKTYWSKRLSYEAGFRNFYCDDLIEQKLRQTLGLQADFKSSSGITSVANWLGYPDSPGFAQREQQYLDCEIAVMTEILAQLRTSAQSGSNVVVDTSGSVIYAGEKVCRELAELTTVCYIKSPAGEEEKMLEQFLREPKPVLWAGHYCPEPGELPQVAMRRCYAKLLSSRRELYQRLAARVIEIPWSLRGKTSLAEFLAAATTEQVSK